MKAVLTNGLRCLLDWIFPTRVRRRQARAELKCLGANVFYCSETWTSVEFSPDDAGRRDGLIAEFGAALADAGSVTVHLLGVTDEDLYSLRESLKHCGRLEFRSSEAVTDRSVETLIKMIPAGRGWYLDIRGTGITSSGFRRLFDHDSSYRLIGSKEQYRAFSHQ
jgi:hypothetical protein